MIWIIGSQGMLGRELSELLKSQLRKVVGSDREVDIRSPETLRDFADSHNPSWIINCSAYTAVDKAEEEADLAFEINRDGAANIARLADKKGIPMIHISTDYVFDGSSPEPLKEGHPTGPRGIYGRSKLAGELEIRKCCPRHFIIRTAWLYGQYGNNFVTTMLKLMNDRENLDVVNDQIGSPTWARDLAEFIIHIMNESPSYFGTFHFSGAGQCSWYEFANEILAEGMELGLLSKSCRIEPCSSDFFPSKAERPAYSLLSKEKISSVFNYAPPHWKDSLHRFLRKWKIKE